MSKKFRVYVVFEFDGIDDPGSLDADAVVDEITAETKRLALGDWSSPVLAVWVDDATVEDEA
jgi:hypothetical protein